MAEKIHFLWSRSVYNKQTRKIFVTFPQNREKWSNKRKIQIFTKKAEILKSWSICLFKNNGSISGHNFRKMGKIETISGRMVTICCFCLFPETIVDTIETLNLTFGLFFQTNVPKISCLSTFPKFFVIVNNGIFYIGVRFCKKVKKLPKVYCVSEKLFREPA